MYTAFMPRTSRIVLEALSAETPARSCLCCGSSRAVKARGARTSRQLAHPPLVRAQDATPHGAASPCLPGFVGGNWSKASEGTCLRAGKRLEPTSSVLPSGGYA